MGTAVQVVENTGTKIEIKLDFMHIDDIRWIRVCLEKFSFSRFSFNIHVSTKVNMSDIKLKVFIRNHDHQIVIVIIF